MKDWIFCKDKMPEFKNEPMRYGNPKDELICYESEWVICRDDNGDVYIGNYDDQGVWYEKYTADTIANVIAWIPIPDFQLEG